MLNLHWSNETSLFCMNKLLSKKGHHNYHLFAHQKVYCDKQQYCGSAVLNNFALITVYLFFAKSNVFIAKTSLFKINKREFTFLRKHTCNFILLKKIYAIKPAIIKNIVCVIIYPRHKKYNLKWTYSKTTSFV